jgi:hypothetical protein
VMRNMDITEFISEHLLQKIHHGILRMDHAQKFHILTLLDIWGQSNNLQSLHVYCSKPSPIPRGHWKIVKQRVCLSTPNTSHWLILTYWPASDIFEYCTGCIPSGRRPA